MIGSLPVNGSVGVDHLNRVFFHGGSDTGNEPGDHFILALHDFCEIISHPAAVDAVLVALPGIVIELCGIEQRFGWDAPFVEAYTPQFFLVEKHHFKAFLPGPFGCYIAGRPSADDSQVIHDSEYCRFQMFTSRLSISIRISLNRAEAGAPSRALWS